DRLQPLRRLQAPRAFLQGSHSGGPPPPRRPAARQAPAALRRPGRPVPRRPPPGHPLRHPGLPAADVRRPHFAPGAAHLPAHLRPGPRRPTGHARRGQPPAGGGRPRPAAPPPRPPPPPPPPPPAPPPPPPPPDPPAPGRPVPLPPPALLWAPTQYAGAFLLLPQALRWLDTARACFPDDYGCLQRGFLTSALAPLVGLGRIFHLDQV